ncbi:MAG: carboxymuconolactone decarboxylase family protein [Dehalococcoidia bacterium]|nr:carboxymuconolactone decarboxylase family protein [Dehalococcoidia bacterium]
MARLPEVLFKSGLPEDKQPIFDAIAESRGRVGFPFSLLLNSPEVAGRVAHLGSFLRFESSLSDVQKELAITAARHSDCEFEWAAHTRLARKVGVREQAIDIIGRHGALDSLTDEEAMIVAYGRELLGKHRVTTETFEAVRSSLGDKGTIELTATLGYYTMLACVLNSCEVPAPSGWMPLP